MFQTAAGVTVPFPEKLSEQYELDGNTITANLWTSRCSSPSIRMRKAMRSGIWTA